MCSNLFFYYSNMEHWILTFKHIPSPPLLHFPPATMVTKRLQQRFLLLQYNYLSAAFAVGVVAILQARAQSLAKKQKAGWRDLTRARKRISMAEVHASLGPIYFPCSFQMSYASFVKLLGILAPAIDQLSTHKTGTWIPSTIPKASR
jgi:hypothetical protein